MSDHRGSSPTSIGPEVSLPISLIVIAKNEAADIADCLRSTAGLVREMIVLDSGSTDGTQDICRACGATVFETDWPGFGPQKNRALSHATSDWVLSLDADERLTPALRAEIRQAVTMPDASIQAYSMPRRSSYCGQFMRHSGWWPDRVVRLFRRDSARFSDKRVHESLIVDGRVAVLREPIAHRAILNLEDSIGKMDAYSTLGAEGLAARNARASLSKAVAKGLWTFFRTYILRLGFLDGRMGLVLAIANAEGAYYKYAKAWIAGRHADAP